MSAHPRAMRQIIATLALAIGLMLACDCPDEGDSLGDDDDDPTNCTELLVQCDGRADLDEQPQAYQDGYIEARDKAGKVKYDDAWCPLGPNDVSDDCGLWRDGIRDGALARAACYWNEP